MVPVNGFSMVQNALNYRLHRKNILRREERSLDLKFLDTKFLLNIVNTVTTYSAASTLDSLREIYARLEEEIKGSFTLQSYIV